MAILIGLITIGIIMLIAYGVGLMILLEDKIKKDYTWAQCILNWLLVLVTLTWLFIMSYGIGRYVASLLHI
jgi:hypothetical protein